MLHRRFTFVLFRMLLVLPLVLTGCRTPRSAMDPPQLQRRGDLPTYSELAHRYNANFANLHRLWARADVTLRYKDEDGRTRSDRGDDSRLLIDLPDHVALSVGGIGSPVLWIGGNAEHYWVFHLRDDRPVYFGRREYIGLPTTRNLPSPVYPHQLPWMLGIVPLDPDVSPQPLVEWHDGYYLIEPPGQSVRMLIDPRTALPARIDMLDGDNASVLAVRLHDHVQLQRVRGAAGEPPLVPSRIEAWILNEDTYVNMNLHGQRDGQGDRAIERAFDAAFDLERLIRAHQPQVQVDLDEPAPLPRQ